MEIYTKKKGNLGKQVKTMMNPYEQNEPIPKKQGGLFSLNLGQNNGPFLPKDVMLTNKKSIKLISQNEQQKIQSKILQQELARTQTVQFYDMRSTHNSNFPKRNLCTAESQKSGIRTQSNFMASGTINYKMAKNMLSQKNIDPKEFEEKSLNSYQYRKNQNDQICRLQQFQKDISQKYTNTANTVDEAEMIYDYRQTQFTNYNEKNKAQLYAAENLVSNSNFLEQKLRQLQNDLEEYKSLINVYRDELKVMNEEVNRTNILSLKEIHPSLKSFQQSLKKKLNEERNENYKLLREIEQLSREKMQIEQNILFSHKRILDLEKFTGVNKQQDQEYENVYEEQYV